MYNSPLDKIIGHKFVCQNCGNSFLTKSQDVTIQCPICNDTVKLRNNEDGDWLQ